MEKEFITTITKQWYKKPLWYPSELQRVFIILDEESKWKIKDKLNLSIEPDICYFNTCEIISWKEWVNMLIRKKSQSYYRLYHLNSLWKLRIIQLPWMHRNHKNKYTRMCTKNHYLVRIHWDDWYSCAYVQSEIPITI